MYYLNLLVFTILTCVDSASIADCDKTLRSLTPIIESINVTQRFLRTPEEYKEYADKCDEIFSCVKISDPPTLAAVQKKMSPCFFYIFYNRDFSSCANKLLAQKDSGIACLNTLFNDIYEPEVDECDQWNDLQPCVQNSIKKFCEDENILKEYFKQEKNLRPDICSEAED